MKTEELLKDFLREFKTWIESGAKEPSHDLIEKRQVLMIRLRKMDRDARAMDRLRETNPGVFWVWRDDIGFLARTYDAMLDDYISDDPVEAILGD